ncbi:lipopolysaccharide-induced tumor necrosis factor-alpha factor homolog [Leguminivora glycinivorella]|uniref:lipopolysaccharide-induced tumor necrosis factor-alpha factor homolog n=1 Tax=Leguminivora glycinivorella TaxID=1035111 RepID=UPI00200C8F4F|nr:lipopolysaccharide-induced tumor necrosis factor-alpha factor homolog [Leguminivora glycinivorella]
MASNAPSAPSDLPPAYSEVIGNPQYGFVAPEGSFADPHAAYQPPKSFTPAGVYPHPPSGATTAQPQAGVPPPGAVPVPVGIVLPQAVGSEPTTITCFNCGKVVTTRVTYTTAWHTHLVAGSVCVITMVCSLCCLGLVPYCFDTFKDAEHYCPNCNTFVGKSTKC